MIADITSGGTQRVLKDPQQLLKKIFASLRGAVFILDATTVQIIDCNPAASEMFGYSRDEMLGQTTTFLHVDEASLEEFRTHLCAAMQVEGFLNLPDFRMKRKNGEVFFTEHTVMPLEDDQGIGIGWVSVVRDITKYKQMVEALGKERDFISAVLSTAGALVLVLDREGRIVRFNRACEQLTGYPFDEVKGKPFWDLFLIPEEIESVKGVFARLQAGQSPNEHENYWVAKDGSRRLIRWSNTVLLGHEGSVEHVIAIGTDLSERKRMEEALRESEQRFRQLAENIEVVFWMESPDGSQIHYVSPAFEKIWGSSVEDLMRDRKIWVRTIHPDDSPRVLRWLEGHSTGGAFDVQEFRIIRPDGEIRWVSDCAFPVRNEKGEIYRVAGFAEDITKRKEAEKALRRIEWLLTKNSKLGSLPNKLKKSYQQPYGNLVEINTTRILTDRVGEDVLIDIVGDFLDLLDSSAAVYEKNGDYALGIFASGWCRHLDQASRNLCGTDNNKEALESGKWHCHESCWNEASKVCIETRQPVDIECRGGIRIFSVPIWAGEEIIGAVSLGYGDPPKDLKKLREISERYIVSMDKLLEIAEAYDSRPFFITELAKNRLLTSAKLIGVMFERKMAEEALQRSRDELEMRVQERTAELVQNNEKLRASESRLRLLSSELLIAQEKERKRVAAELHDSTAASLSAIKFQMENVANQMKQGAAKPESLEPLIERVQQAVVETRRIMADLRPSVLDDLGIAPAISWFCRQFQETYPNINIQKEIGIEEKEVPESLKTVIFRISQEALNNIAKHSKANTVHLSLVQSGTGIELIVRDNGQGFDLKTIRPDGPGKGLGLVGMRERAELSGGSFSIESIVGEGTRICVSWPL